MTIPANAHKILDAQKIELKLDRMAFQALEMTYDKDHIVILGIAPGGVTLAKKLMEKIKQYDGKKSIEFSSIHINKTEPLKEEIKLNDNLDLSGKTILIVDDVGNTGRTLFYALKPLTSYIPDKIIVVVLVDRAHKAFPINADIVGFPMATTYNEHIIVQFDGEQVEGAYLF
jgi:pyrimidine operon attenuation protein/uracil phosphoribosyltransferase